MEHVVKDHIKIVYLCEEDEGIAVGDLPLLPWCFKCRDELKVLKVSICWSDDIVLKINDREVKLRIELGHVEGKQYSIMFMLNGIKCSWNPDKVYTFVEKFIHEVCSK